MNRKYEIYQYVLPTYMLPALINGDVSGLEDSEIERLEAFEQLVIKDCGAGHWSQESDEIDVDSESYFARSNDIDGNIGNNVEDWLYVVFD